MMKNKNKIFSATFFVSVFCFLSFTFYAQVKSTVTKTIEGKKFIIHTVEKGQSLYAISRLYGFDVSTVLSYNQDAIDGLKVGEELKIPTDNYISKTLSSSNTLVLDTNKYICHKVVKGETIYGITKKYNIDDKTLTSFNPAIVQGIREGDVLIVGTKKASTKQYTNNQQVAVNTTTLTSTLQQPIFNNQSNTDSLLLNKLKKTSYRIGLFLPFKLNQLELINIDELVHKKSSFPSTQDIAMDFYTGFKKVVDSLSSQNFDITLSLFDIDERDSAKIEAICRTAEFKKLDAIFGPLNATEFKLVASKAKELGIPAVSPLVQNNKILFNNSMLSKVTPSQHTLIEGLADYCMDSLSNSHIILVNTIAKDLPYTKTFKKRFNDNLLKSNSTIKDSLLEVKGIAGVKSAYRANKKNIVVAFTYNPVYLQDFITQLANFSDKKDIVLIGFNSVSNIDNLDQEYLNRLQFHFASTTHIDYTQEATKNLARYYQDIFNTEPSEYFFEGYDVASYYLTNLKNEGASFFANLDKIKSKGVSTDFKFYRPDSATGYENRAMSIYKYDNFKLVKTGW